MQNTKSPLSLFLCVSKIFIYLDDPLPKLPSPLQHDFWLSASDDLVRRYVKHGTQLHGFVTNTSGIRIRSIAIDTRGKKIAVASESVFPYCFSLLIYVSIYSELIIKVIDVEDNSVVQRLEGHNKGVRRVSWDPTNTFLVRC